MEEQVTEKNQEICLTYTNIHYYNNYNSEEELEYRCPKGLNGDLIIDDNTVYEIDSECYKYLERKRAKRGYR